MSSFGSFSFFEQVNKVKCDKIDILARVPPY
jgi:hypothetical protein